MSWVPHMADEKISEQETLRRMNEALKRALNMPPS
jgi:hypothetical protein